VTTLRERMHRASGPPEDSVAMRVVVAAAVEIAILAADIRHDRIVQACAKASPVEELMPVFATLLAHLP